jgi:hypothetical protein
VSDDEPSSPSTLLRSACQGETGLVVVYPDRSYADHKGLTCLNQLRQHLPKAAYDEALPAQIRECCRKVSNRVSLRDPARLEMTGTFDLGKQSIRFRVVSLTSTRPNNGAPVLVLLNLLRNDR